ncbi:MAG: hypothetical protein Kow0029_13550 [Candidatus Rifleibacteriota bacterium]
MKKFALFVLFVVLLGGLPVYAEVSFDFDGNSTLDDRDLAIMIGWKQLVNAGVDTSLITTSAVQSVASQILSSVTTVSRLPDVEKDNLSTESTAVLDDQDIAYFISYKQLVNAGVTNFSFANVESVASQLINLTTNLGKFPGTTIGNSTLTTTITGITTGSKR